MKRFARLQIALGILLATAVAQGEDHGSLVIIGGGLRHSQADVWQKIVELAGGEGAKIAVFPTASGEPLTSGSRSLDALRASGADAFLVPLYFDRTNDEHKRLVVDPALVEQVQQCGGIFFTGGSQERITAALGSSAGDRTPVLDAIWDVYRRGGVVAGTSAGAAVMSASMFRSSPSIVKTLQNGLEHGRELGPGLGFLANGWFVEQHCLARGRFARTLVALRTLNLNYGLGVDENTAVVVERGRDISVLGYRGAIVLDLSQATTDPQTKGFNIKNAKVSYLDRGDAFNLENLELTPSEHKRSGQPIVMPTTRPQEARTASTGATRSQSLVVGDILGNSTLVDLLVRLIDRRDPEAIGLAFDAAEALEGPTQGFEFRFYRGDDSRGWYSSANGASDYTVANIHLDVRPVEIAGPLYK